MSIGGLDPRVVANLDPWGMIGRIYEGYHLTLLHIKYTGFRSLWFKNRRCFMCFQLYKPMVDNDAPGRGQSEPHVNRHDLCLSSTANATFFFLLSSFKYENNKKTFVFDYHLNDPTTFLHHQIQVHSAHARILAFGYKNAFSVFHVHGSFFFLTPRTNYKSLKTAR